MTSTVGPPAAPPAWYPDPWRRAEWRWWNGQRWTAQVATAGLAGWDGPDAPSTRAAPAPGTLPFRGVGLAAAGLVAGIILSGLTGGVTLVVTGGDTTSAAVTAAGLIGLWGGLVGACVIASRSLGSGRLRSDLGLAWSRLDPLRGVGLNVVGRVASTVVAVPFVAAGLSSSNTQIVRAHRGSAVSLFAVGVAVVVGAPIVEELFFRGRLRRSLSSRLRWGWAVVIQAVVFGLAHADPTAGWSTLSLIAITATFGVTQGLAARRWSLGPLMVSHALFNLLPVLLIAAK